MSLSTAPGAVPDRRVHAFLYAGCIAVMVDAQRFAEAGGMVPMAVEEDRVHFSVNHDAATAAKLQISAKLLTLSHIIHHAGALGTK
jgi:hypothetical protein